VRCYQLSRQDLQGYKKVRQRFFIIETIVDKYFRGKKEAEYTGALWTSRNPSIQLIEKPYGLR
jgi:hypothetical protein